MSKEPTASDDPDVVDDEPLFYDEDFAIDEFVDTQDIEPAPTRSRRRQLSLRRVEVRREQKWLERQLSDWDDYDD